MAELFQSMLDATNVPDVLNSTVMVKPTVTSRLRSKETQLLYTGVGQNYTARYGGQSSFQLRHRVNPYATVDFDENKVSLHKHIQKLGV